MIRISIKWLIVLVLFALIVMAWKFDGGVVQLKNTASATPVASVEPAEV